MNETPDTKSHFTGEAPSRRGEGNQFAVRAIVVDRDHRHRRRPGGADPGIFFLIPLAIAVMLFSLTSAAIEFISRLRTGRFYLPNWLASIVAVLIIAAAL